MRSERRVSLMRISVLAFFVLGSYYATAQSDAYQGGVEGGVSIAFPQNNFAKKAGGNPFFGLGLHMVFAIKDNHPVQVVVGAQHYWLHVQRSKGSLLSPDSVRYNYQTNVRGSMIPFHVHIRLTPFIKTNSPLQPYFEVLLGMRLYQTSVKLEGEESGGGTSVISAKNNDWDLSHSHGFAAGLQVQVTEMIHINARFENLFGGWANYIDPDQISFTNDGGAQVERMQSRTDIIAYTLGVSIRLNTEK